MQTAGPGWHTAAMQSRASPLPPGYHQPLNIVLIHIQRFADGVVMPAGDVMQAAQGRVGGFEVPVAFAEHPGVGPGRDYFTDKQVVGSLVMRLGAP